MGSPRSVAGECVAVSAEGADDVSATYARLVLASLLAAYPGREFEEEVELLLGALAARAAERGDEFGLAEVVGAYAAVKRSEAFDDLRSDYIDTFDRGRQRTSLSESEYGRERVLAKGQTLADVCAFYSAFGLEFGGGEGHGDMADHLAVELEFYALMCLKHETLAALWDENGAAIVADACGQFLLAHLGRIPGVVAARPVIAEHAFYGPAFRFIAAVVASECARWGVTPEPVEWLTKLDTDDPVGCGHAATEVA